MAATTPVVVFSNDDEVIGAIATEEERGLLKQLREAVAPFQAKSLTADECTYNELTGDLRLLRFLRGYKGSVPNATTVRACGG
jgi:hypothetical protein